MKYLCLLTLVALAAMPACKQKENKIAVDSGLRSDFGYRQGSYWVYRDSVSGEVDSAYVISSGSAWHEAGGCLRMTNAPQIETMTIQIGVSNGNPASSETWNMSMTEKKFSMYFANDRDKTESQLRLDLFTYPAKVGDAPGASGCIPSADSGRVADINTMNLHDQQYSNTIDCPHARLAGPSPWDYNDRFYMSPKAGLVKVVFRHPSDSVYRVLELQRYKIVK